MHCAALCNSTQPFNPWMLMTVNIPLLFKFHTIFIVSYFIFPYLYSEQSESYLAFQASI